MKTGEKTDMKSLTLEELTGFVEACGEKPFRAKQLYHWMHVSLVEDFDQMTNLSRSFRDTLKEKAVLGGCHAAKVQTSTDGTKKFLMELSDGNFVESVLMKYKHGNSVCISTQAGCRMGCRL